jgi:membrane associated rhomboid family serine protease
MENDYKALQDIREMLLAIYLTVLGIAAAVAAMLFGISWGAGLGALLVIFGFISAVVGFRGDWTQSE